MGVCEGSVGRGVRGYEGKGRGKGKEGRDSR